MRDAVSDTVLPIVAGETLPAAAGGKAAGLQSILEAGLPIPEAWVVLPDAGKADIDRLARALERRNLTSLAVRSSAAGEDAKGASFAGIHESLLGVQTRDLHDAVRTVAVSPLSNRASAYRREMGLPPAEGPCAAVVQSLVPAKCAGVAFGIGEKNCSVVVEAVEGLGEPLVQGQETPETWELLHRAGSWTVSRRKDRRQERALVAEGGTTQSVVLPPRARTAPLLTAKQASKIADGVRRLQESARTPLDVEWCQTGDSLAFVQARPRTRPVGTPFPGQMWTRSNFREVLPDLTSALTRSFVLRALGRGLDSYVSPFKFLRDRQAPLMTCIHGRLVANETLHAEILDRLGIPRSLMDVTLGGGEGGEDRFEPMNLRRQARYPVLMLKSIGRALGAPRRARKVIRRARALGEEVRSLDLATMPDEALIPYLGPITLEFGESFALASILLVATLQGAQYRIAGMLRTLPYTGALITRLVAPELRTVSTQLTDELTGLALAFRRWDGGAAFLDAVSDEHRSPAPWKAALPPALFQEVEAWATRFAHRGPYESDLSSPRYGDDWRLIAVLLEPLVDAEDSPESPDARRARLAHESETAWREARSRLGRLKRCAIRNAVNGLRGPLALREELRSETIACMYAMRTVFLEAGRRLAARGRLAEATDVWHLTVDELSRAMRDPKFDSAGAVAREKGRRAAWRRIEVPNRFRSEDVPHLLDRIRETLPPAAVLTGTGISPGLAEGRARLLETPAEGVALEAGEILVTHTTDPGWTPLFARAGGVLVEMGGTLSHAGIVAREFGIPSVGNVDDAMHRIQNGQLLSIDGTKGAVHILEETNEVAK